MTVPSRNVNAVYQQLCELSPRAYAVLARMIVATARAERINRSRRNLRRANRRFLMSHSNIGKPVITISHDDEREGA